VSASYTYRITPRVSVRQELRVIAQWRDFRFTAEDRSDLTRTSTLRTNSSAKISNRIELSLNHSYNFRNSGPFFDDLYQPQLEYIEQTLTVGCDYTPVVGVRVRGENSLRSVENRSPGQPEEPNLQYDTRITANLNRRLLNAVDAKLNATRVLSTREENHWQVDMSVSRTF
jgi:hypothetical protein